MIKNLKRNILLVLSVYMASAFLVGAKIHAQTTAPLEQYIDKNYVTNGGFESSTAGWKAYKDTAGAAPITGSGGSPTTTITSSTSAPIAGKASGLFTHPASNTQGEGISISFVTDKNARGKVITISGSYEVLSGTYSGGTPSTVSDVVVYIYDVDSGTIIQPSGYKLDGGVQGITYNILAQFQPVNLTSVNYRLILHTATTTASSFVLKLDSIKIGIGNKSQGPPETDWVAYTPTITGFGTTSNVMFISRRVGDTLEVLGQFKSGTPTAVPGTFTLGYAGGNANVTIDSVKVSAGTQVGAGSLSVGSAQYLSILASSGGNLGYVMTQSSTQSGFTLSTNASAWISSTNAVSFFAKFPIAGWSSSIAMSDSADARVIVARATSTGLSGITAGSVLQISTIAIDTHGGMNVPTAGRYTVLVPGYYEVSAAIQYSSGNPAINLYKNGSVYASLFSVITGALSSGRAIVQANAGDILDIRPDGTTTTGSMNYIEIKKLSGLSQIAASESVVGSWQSTATTSLTNNVFTTITYSSTLKDSHVEMNTSTGIYTAPVAGTYMACGNINATASVVNQLFDIALTVGAGSAITRQSNNIAGALTSVQNCLTAPMLAGQTAFQQIRCTFGSGTCALTSALNQSATFSVTRVGNY